MRRPLAAFLALLLLPPLLAGTARTAALLTDRARASGDIATARVFPGTRSAWPHDIGDASSGTEIAVHDPLAFEDGVALVTSPFGASFADTRYVAVGMEPSAPGRADVSSATLRVRYGSADGNKSCIWVELHDGTSGGVLGSSGSPANPVCTAGNSLDLATFDVSRIVTSTAVARDLVVRVYGQSPKERPIRLDAVRLALVVDGMAYVELPSAVADRSAGNGGDLVPWAFEADGDGQGYRSGDWPASADPSRYLRLGFDASVPEKAQISRATLVLAYRTTDPSARVCDHLAIYAQGSLLRRIGSADDPRACTTGSLTDAIDLGDLSVADARTLEVRVVTRASAGATVTDLARLELQYLVP